MSAAEAKPGSGVLEIEMDPCPNLGMAAVLLSRLLTDVVMTSITSPDWNSGRRYGGEVMFNELQAKWSWEFKVEAMR